MSFHPRHCSESRLCCLAHTHASPPTHSTQPEYQHIRNVSRLGLRNICCLRQLLVMSPSQRMRFKMHQINRSKLSHPLHREGRAVGRWGWSGIRQVVYCFCLMSCKMHPSEWKQVIYCCKKCLWQQAALLLTDSVGVFNRRSNKTPKNPLLWFRITYNTFYQRHGEENGGKFAPNPDLTCTYVRNIEQV